MGILFEDSDDYPDYLSMPRFTARIGDTVIPLAIAATLHGICPVVLEDHSHPAHEDHSPRNVRLDAIWCRPRVATTWLGSRPAASRSGKRQAARNQPPTATPTRGCAGGRHRQWSIPEISVQIERCPMNVASQPPCVHAWVLYSHQVELHVRKSSMFRPDRPEAWIAITTLAILVVALLALGYRNRYPPQDRTGFLLPRSGQAE